MEFVKQIYNWQPSLYNDSKELPENMPADLKNYIEMEERRGRKNVSGESFVFTSINNNY